MSTNLLRHDEILQVRAAVISARLSESRASLLAGLPVEFVASLAHAAAPGEQVLVDLDVMNTVGALVDGSIPLITWLSNAVALTGLRAEAMTLEAVRNRCHAREARERAFNPRSQGSSAPPHNLPPRRFFVGRDRELAHIDEVLRGETRSSIARVSLWGLGGVGKTALALESAHRALARNQYPGGVWWVMAEGRPLDAMQRLEVILRSRANFVLNWEATPRTRIESQRLELEALNEPSLLVLDNVSERGFLKLLPGNKVRVLMTTRDRSVALGEDAWLDVLTLNDAHALATQIAGSTEGENETLDRVVFDMLGGLAVAVEVAARAVKLWAGGWDSYEKLLYKQPGKALDREKDRSEHYPPGVFAALDASMARCSNLARQLLEGLAAFAADAVPLAWAFEAAKLDPEDIESQEALGALDGLGLLNLERSAAVASLHRLVRARVREQTVPEAWRETRRRAVKQVASWVTTAVQQNDMDAIGARRAFVDEALVAAEGDEDAVMWSVIADGLATHLEARQEDGEAYDEAETQSLLERAMTLIGNADEPEHPALTRCLLNLKRVLERPENEKLARERAVAERHAREAAQRLAEEEALQELWRVAKLAQHARQRWMEAIPACLARHWNGMQGHAVDLSPIREALDAAYPDPSVRSLVLFEWLGSSDGPWSDVPWEPPPNYESMVELLLLEYPTHVLVAGLTSHALTSAHLQGATRYIATWYFRRHKPRDLDEIPNELKNIFLTHSHTANYDETKLIKIKRAFGYEPAQEAVQPAAAPDGPISPAVLDRAPRG